ncbi:MAG: LPS export ABC transporter permease LptF [Rhodocyclales bacterium]|nr:LPS export ABC transporter permease LptF [Rhodocyclales bacterium]
MIFRRSILAEIVQNTVMTAVGLLAVALTVLVVRLVSQAASGDLPADILGPALGLSTLAQMPLVLVLGGFAGALLTIQRLARDSELVVWRAAGVSRAAFYDPLVAFMLPLTAVVLWLTLWVSPWADRQRAELEASAAARDETQSVAAGVFRESGDGRRVFFVMATEEGRNQLFARLLNDEGKTSVVLAAEAELFQRDGAQWVRLRDGRRYDESDTPLSFRVVQFAWQELRLQSKTADEPKFRLKSRPIDNLLAQPGKEELAELARRLGLPLALILFILMALPLGESNPRTSRGYTLILALLIFVSYTNLISVSYGWIARGKLSFVSGLLLPHGLAFATWLALLYWRRKRG